MRRLVVLALLLLMVLPLQAVNPAIPLHPEQKGNVALAADGDESGDSILSFEETLVDDILHYPDQLENTTIELANDGTTYTTGDATVYNNYTHTHYVDVGNEYAIIDGTAPCDDVYIYLNFSVTVGDWAIDGFDYNIYTYSVGGGGDYLQFYDFTADSWTNYDLLNVGSSAWENDTIYDSDYWDSEIWVRCAGTTASGVPHKGVGFDYAEITFYIMTLVDADHYGESFADVSDWTTSDTSISTDDDMATITENGAGSTGKTYDVISSTDFFEYYYEFRIHSMTVTGAALEFYDGANYNTLLNFTTTGTKRGIISDSDAATMTRIGFWVNGDSQNIVVDYLRLSPHDEMGFSHDGSTTEGVEQVGGGIFNSDGDHISLTADADGSRFDFFIDTTATKADIDLDYYPFVEMCVHADDVGDQVKVEYYVTGVGYTTVQDTTELTQTMRWNLRALTSNDIQKLRVWVFISQTVRIDFLGAYSIANFTVTQSATTTDDVLYTSSSILHSIIDDGYIELNHDPALSVNTATYNVWNITTQTTVPQSAYYVAAWSAYSSETRGSLSSGTLTDLKLNVSTAISLSAIKFIEDATAPIINNVWVNPNDPDDAEAVTFTAYTTDTVEVYSVTLNAAIYPNGFSDTDYSMTEDEEDTTWYYEFTTMTAGYYLFLITASDGANTDSEYLPLSVIEAGITLEPISLIGAGPDFTGVQFSFECNRAGTFSITEWTAVNETYATDEAETHTGTIIDGYNNIFWTKLATTSLTVYFNFTIDSGSLQANWTSTYQVAQVTFDVVLSDKNYDFDNVYLQGESTKDATYSIYIDEILRYTGSIPEGSWDITFVMWSKASLTDHDFAIEFVNGTNTDWINGTYYAGSPDEYKGGGVDTGPLAWWADPMTWLIIGAGLAGVYIFTSGQKTGNLPNAPKGMT